MIRIRSSILSLAVILNITVSACAETVMFDNQKSIIENYVKEKNSAQTVLWPLEAGEVGSEYRDLDGNGSLDLVLSHLKFCSNKSCVVDAYLCTGTQKDCKDAKYCFAASLPEGQLKKLKNIECKK